MPNLEDVFEMLAPFAFLLIWIFSAVSGRTRENPPATTSRPVFAPAKTGPDQATVRPEPGRKIDWRDLEAESPYRNPTFGTDPKTTSEEAERRERLQRAVRERQLREAAKARREAAESARRPAEDLSQTNKPVNLSHLVPDHAAEMHLEHSLTNQPAAQVQATRKQNPLAASVLTSAQDRDAVRKALIMSVLLGEPRSRSKKIRS